MQESTRKYRTPKSLTHQEKMQIYNDVKSCLYYQKEIAVKYNITTQTLRKVQKEIDELIAYKLYGITPKKPTICNVCGGKVIFKRATKYQSRSGFMYYCTSCHSWVATHPKNQEVALGELGDKETRHKRKELHNWFDKLWETKTEREMYYQKLSKELGKERCHFSQMNDEELTKSLAIVKKWWFEKFDK